MTTITTRRGARARLLAAALVTLSAMLPAREARAQWSRVYDQFYLPAAHNWTFRKYYPQADRLFNAFDYGHAVLYETLWARPTAPASRLEVREYDYLTRTLLPNPPRVPLVEEAIEPLYARLAPEAKAMFEWAHLLHRQVYDVLADERLPQAEKDAEVARLLAYYRSRGDLAFSRRPKTMALMQEQWYSLAFRQRYPKFNGLIWAYHWLQVGLYEPLLVGRTFEERQAGVTASVARFEQMLTNAPATMPYQMPMTSAIAPRFAARYPEAAIVFDNLHSMHDVISDILANPAVARGRKRAEILLAARRFRDDTTEVMSVDGWRRMSAMMGLENMGGPAVGFVAQLPTPSVARGAVMRHDREGNMVGEHAARGTAGSAGAAHGGHAPAATEATRPAGGDEHAGHTMGAAGGAADSAAHGALMALQMRLLRDPATLARLRADSALRRALLGTMEGMPAEHRAHVEALLRGDGAAHEHGGMHGASVAPASAPARPDSTRRPAARARPAAPRARPRPEGAKPTPAKPPADPHAGHGAPPARP